MGRIASTKASPRFVALPARKVSGPARRLVRQASPPRIERSGGVVRHKSPNGAWGRNEGTLFSVSVHLSSRQAPGLLMNGGAVLSLSEQVTVDVHHIREEIRNLSGLGLNGNVSTCLHQLRDAELLPG
jgi:hypothetical protein